MVMVSDGKSRPQPMRLQLSSNMLVLQKEEMVPVGLPATPAVTSLKDIDAQVCIINFINFAISTMLVCNNIVYSNNFQRHIPSFI